MYQGKLKIYREIWGTWRSFQNQQVCNPDDCFMGYRKVRRTWNAFFLSPSLPTYSWGWGEAVSSIWVKPLVIFKLVKATGFLINRLTTATYLSNLAFLANIPLSKIEGIFYLFERQVCKQRIVLTSLTWEDFLLFLTTDGTPSLN